MEAELVALKKVLDGPDAPEVLTAALAKLEAMSVTVALLESTQIGVSVGKLRRHANNTIAETSKRIVNSWRGLLKPATPSPAASQSSPASVRDSGSLKRSSSEVGDEADGKKAKGEAKGEVKAEVKVELKKSKSSLSEAKDDEAKRAKTDEKRADKKAPAPAAAKETDEEARGRCSAMLAEALATPPLPSADGATPLKDVAAGIERALFSAYDGLSKEYRERFRMLFLNLKNPKNTELRLHLAYGELPFERLVRMTSDELAPREVQEEKARIADWQMKAITRGVDKSTATDLYRCSKCQQRKTTYYEMQTRSADEPMTVFITCLNCGNRWKM